MSILSDVKLHNFMPSSILESDDDTWSSGGSSHSSDAGCATSPRDYPPTHSDYSMYDDYFGLNNLVNNIKISEDNPLLGSNPQRNSDTDSNSQDGGQRIAWVNNGTTSPTIVQALIDTQAAGFDEKSEESSLSSSFDIRQLPPPSMRLSKSMRDHIISGKYQQEINNRNTSGADKSVLSSLLYSHQVIGSGVNTVNSMQGTDAPISQHGRSIPAGLHVCVFCRNNGEAESVYTSHVLKDAEGRTSCPILRAYTCPICKSNGDNSHTIKYCPANQNGRFSSATSHGGFSGPPPPGLNMNQSSSNIGQRNYQGQANNNY